MKKVSILILLCVTALLVAGAATMALASPAGTEEGSIGGTVLYRGVQAGAPEVDVLLFDDVSGSPLTTLALPFPGGAYNLGEGPDGSYYVAAQLDLDDSGGPPDPGEPFAWYDANLDGTADLITIAGSDATGVDVLLPALPAWWQAGEAEGDWFGEAVGAAGDVDGDGYPELLVGARYANGGAYRSGQAYLYYGTAGGPESVPQVISPPVANSNGYFGETATGAGDVNGDGYDDILISMPNYESGSGTADEGAVFVWYGSADGIEGGYDWHAEGEATYAHLGLDYAAATAGDVNGDGYDDIIAGAVRYDYNNVSHAYVWYGSASGLDTGSRPVGTPANADWFAAAPTNDGNPAWFGRVAGPAGDVNGDGYDDVFVGAHNWESEAGQANEGAVFVWYGSESGLGASGTPANADWSAQGEQAEARLGYHAAAAGDVNGDGYGDFVAGAYLYDNGAANAGQLRLYYGSAGGLATSPGWTAEGVAENVQLGLNVGTGADLNGDGYDDVLASAHGFDAAALTPIANAGAVLGWYGGAGGPGDPGTPLNADWRATGDQENGYFGYTMMAGRADFDGDGLADVGTGTYYYDNPGQGADGGRAYLFMGAPDPITGLAASGRSPLLLGQTTTLTATVDGGTALAFRWETGDGHTAPGAVIDYAYEAAGSYTATVTVSNTLHSRTAATVILVQEGVAGLAAANDGPTVLGQPTTLQATATAGSDLTYLWDFGDGESGSGAAPTHTYAASGTYTATVTAANAVSSAQATTVVTVEEPVTETYLYLPLLRRE